MCQTEVWVIYTSPRISDLLGALPPGNGVKRALPMIKTSQSPISAAIGLYELGNAVLNVHDDWVAKRLSMYPLNPTRVGKAKRKIVDPNEGRATNLGISTNSPISLI